MALGLPRRVCPLGGAIQPSIGLRHAKEYSDASPSHRRCSLQLARHWLGPTMHSRSCRAATYPRPPVNFVTYNPLSGSPTDATGTITVSARYCWWAVCQLVDCSEQGRFRAATTSCGKCRWDRLSELQPVHVRRAYQRMGDGTGGTAWSAANLFWSSDRTRWITQVYGRVPAGRIERQALYGLDHVTVTYWRVALA